MKPCWLDSPEHVGNFSLLCMVAVPLQTRGGLAGVWNGRVRVLKFGT